MLTLGRKQQSHRTRRRKAAVQRFIGMVNYFSPFCEHLSSIIKPPRNLAHNGLQFKLSEVQEKMLLTKLKKRCKSTSLAYYDLHKPGAAQQRTDEHRLRPIAFRTCSMSPAEQRYSQSVNICYSFSKCDYKRC